jgi:hypothetical protein
MIGELCLGTHVHCVTRRYITALCNERTAYKVKSVAVRSSLLYLQCDVGVGEVASAGTPLSLLNLKGTETISFTRSC